MAEAIEDAQDVGEELENSEDFVDPEMKGLTLDEQKWFVVQKGFDQVKKFCEDIGLPQYYDLFLKNKFSYGNKIRRITQFEVQTKFLLTDPDEIEAILAHSANLVKDDEITTFQAKYGEPDQLIFECTKGIKFLEDHAHWYAEDETLSWFYKKGRSQADVQDTKTPLEDPTLLNIDPTQLTFAQKWRIHPDDYQNFSKTEGLWATASSCDGMVFMWPLDRPLDNPPQTTLQCVTENPEENVHYPGCVRAAYVHPYVTTDYCFDFERMLSISCGGDCRVCFYDMENSKLISTVKNDKGIDVTQAFICCDGDSVLGKVAIGTCNGPLKIGDLERGKVVQILKGHTDDIYDVKANWDENLIVTGSWDHTLGTFDLRSGKRVRTMVGHTVVLNRIDVSFEQMMAVSFASEQPFMLWDLKDGRCVKVIEGHHGGQNDGVVNWRTMEAVTGGEDGLVKFWDLESGNCKRTFDCDHLQTLAVDVNWDQGLLLTGSWDHKVRVWDLQTGQKYHELKKARRTITQVCIMGGRGSG